MVTKYLLDFGFALIGQLMALLPTSGPPTWWSTVSGYVGQMWSYAAELGAWIPWNLAAICVPAVFVAMGVGFAIKLARILLSLFTGGGGSAA